VQIFINFGHNHEPATNFHKKKKNDVRKSYLNPYNEIIYNISQQIRERFQNLEKLKFLELFDCQKRNGHKDNFPGAAFQSPKLWPTF
jgi:hypothetical protein